MRKDPRHDCIHVPGQDARHISDGFALTKTDLVGGEVQGIATRLAHSHVETDTGAQAGFLEDHSKDFPLQEGRIAAGEVFLLEADCQVQKSLQFFRRIIGHSQKIFFHRFSL